MEPSRGPSTTLTGTLVDSTWILRDERRISDDDRRRIAANLASGVPAAIIPDESQERALTPTLSRGERGEAAWILLTAPAVLAPYAGMQMRVEGQPVQDQRAIIPSTMYVADGDIWRQVQLAAPPQGAKETEPHPAEHPPDREAPKETPPEHARDRTHEEEPESWLVLQMPPAHPLLVNFTAGLFPAAVAADWLGRMLRRRPLHAAALWMLLLAALAAPLTALAGWLWHDKLGHSDHPQMDVHEWLGLSLAIAIPALAVWRVRIANRQRDPGARYLTAATTVLLALALQGHLGATMSFMPHENPAAQAERRTEHGDAGHHR